jgi:UPF0176 protein
VQITIFYHEIQDFLSSNISCVVHVPLFVVFLCVPVVEFFAGFMSASSLRQPFRVLLYYKYIPIPDYKHFAVEHAALCRSLGLLGRIIIAPEGINGTVSGTPSQTDTYIAEMRTDSRFDDVYFKADDAQQIAFKKLIVRAKNELVTWRFEEQSDIEIDPNTQTGNYLSPKEFHEALHRDDVIVLDGRNGYEYDIGHFHGAIRPDVQSSREFPAWIREHFAPVTDKNKLILTYCTGGIRCEKLTGFLINEGFRNVAQLHGGIVSYAKDPATQGKLFDGRCYVFDERISVPVRNDHETDALPQPTYCETCGKPSENRVHCSWRPHCTLTVAS